METRAMVRTPAECLEKERSFPRHAPISAAHSNRNDNFISIAAETGGFAKAARDADAVAADAVAAAAAAAASVATTTGSVMVEALARSGTRSKGISIAVAHRKNLRFGGFESRNESENIAGSLGCCNDDCNSL